MGWGGVGWGGVGWGGAGRGGAGRGGAGGRVGGWCACVCASDLPRLSRQFATVLCSRMAPWSNANSWRQGWQRQWDRQPQHDQVRDAAKRQKDIMRTLAIQLARDKLFALASSGSGSSPGSFPSPPTCSRGPEPQPQLPQGWAHGQQAWGRTVQQRALGQQIRHSSLALESSSDPQERAGLSAALKRIRGQVVGQLPHRRGSTSPPTSWRSRR